jgi:hypothetical protein
MDKEKSKKTTQTEVPYPAGIHHLRFGPSQSEDRKWALGCVNLLYIENEGRHVGAIQFSDEVEVVLNQPYPLEVTFHEDGTIHFHIQGATAMFGPVLPQFQFMFNGTTDGIVLSGTGGVPQAFIPNDPKAEPGEPVNWTSRGPGDQHPKPSK